jgi:hypothetical protein
MRSVFNSLSGRREVMGACTTANMRKAPDEGQESVRFVAEDVRHTNCHAMEGDREDGLNCFPGVVVVAGNQMVGSTSFEKITVRMGCGTKIQ